MPFGVSTPTTTEVNDIAQVAPFQYSNNGQTLSTASKSGTIASSAPNLTLTPTASSDNLSAAVSESKQASINLEQTLNEDKKLSSLQDTNHILPSQRPLQVDSQSNEAVFPSTLTASQSSSVTPPNVDFTNNVDSMSSVKDDMSNKLDVSSAIHTSTNLSFSPSVPAIDTSAMPQSGSMFPNKPSPIESSSNDNAQMSSVTPAFNPFMHSNAPNQPLHVHEPFATPNLSQSSSATNKTPIRHCSHECFKFAKIELAD